MLNSVQLGRDGSEVRPLGVGTNSWNERTFEGAREAFSASLDAGITLIDTAEVYGRGESERVIGRLLSESGRSAAVATKFAPLPLRLSEGSLRRALAASLGRLELASVDLYQVHWPFTFVRIETLMRRLAHEVAAGRVRGVGVSNYGATQMRRAHAALAEAGIPLVSNQVNYSLLHRAPETNGVLYACRELGTTLIAYTPLASGALTGKYRPDGRRPTGVRRHMGAFRNLEQVMPVVEELGKIGARTRSFGGSGGPELAGAARRRAADSRRQGRPPGNGERPLDRFRDRRRRGRSARPGEPPVEAMTPAVRGES